MSLRKIAVYTKNSKRGPCCWSKWDILPQFCTPPATSQECIFNKTFVCSAHIIISRQMKCEIHRIFKSFFNLRAFLLYTKPNLFCPFDHLPNCHCLKSAYLICLYSLTLNLTWWVCQMSTQQGRTHIFYRRSIFVTNQIF